MRKELKIAMELSHLLGKLNSGDPSSIILEAHTLFYMGDTAKAEERLTKALGKRGEV